jgi:hypothetical protein
MCLGSCYLRKSTRSLTLYLDHHDYVRSENSDVLNVLWPVEECYTHIVLASRWSTPLPELTRSCTLLQFCGVPMQRSDYGCGYLWLPESACSASQFASEHKHAPKKDLLKKLAFEGLGLVHVIHRTSPASVASPRRTRALTTSMNLTRIPSKSRP